MVGLDRKFVVEGYGKIQYILQTNISGTGKTSCHYLRKSMQGPTGDLCPRRSVLPTKFGFK
jgi:hypothetical protein